MDPAARHNRQAWDGQVRQGNRWTLPVTDEQIDRARGGDWSIVLTPSRPVPRRWFPELDRAEVLCLAGGGGQQGPLLAAAGARVTVLDNSPLQLERDAALARRHDLSLITVLGDMRHLDSLGAERFALVVNPVSTCFVPEVQRVWDGCRAVLAPGGALIAGLVNPLLYLFDDEALDRGEWKVAHRLPWSDLEALDERRLAGLAEEGRPIEFSHSLEELIGGQLRAGLTLDDLYEDDWDEGPLAGRAPWFIATRALRPALVPSTGSESMRSA